MTAPSVDQRRPGTGLASGLGRGWHVPGAMLVVVAVWGSAFSGIKVLLRDLSPGGLTAGRLLVAALTYSLLALVLRRTRVERRPGDLVKLLVIGVSGSAVYHYALNWGEQRVSAGVASLIVATMPVMVALAAALLLGERLNRHRVAGIVLAFGGVTALVLASGEGLRGSAVGVAVTLLSPLSWAVYTLTSKTLADRYDGVSINLLGAWVGALLTVPFGLGDLDALARLSLGSWLWLLYLGALSTAVAYVVYAWALRSWTAGGVASFVYLVPVSSFLWAWVLLGEVPTIGTVVGGALVIVGVVLVQRRTRTPPARTETV